MLTSRRGFTLVELLIALSFMGLIAAAVVVLLLRQQRFYTGANEVVQTRQQLRQTVAILPAELRAISSGGGDIYVMTDSSLEFRAVYGASFACRHGDDWLSTVPLRLAKGNALGYLLQVPVAGDSVAVYDDSTSTAVRDDRWTLTEIKKVELKPGDDNSGCPLSSGLVQAADLTTDNPSYKLTLTSKAGKTAVANAGVRFFRRVHYSLYRAADGRWYLGYYDCRTGRSPVCNPTQPIAGPFQPYAADGTSGLQFSYYDSTGAVTTDKQAVARISVVVRGTGEGLIALSGTGAHELRDSLRIEVALRNRK